MQRPRWTSRKFLLSLSTQIVAIAVLLWPEHESVIVQAAQSITALLVLALSTLGYVAAEASLDRAARSESDNDQPSTQGNRI